MRKILGLSVILLGFLTTSCATIVSNSIYDVAINSSPSGAKFSITNSRNKIIETGVTPATVQLKSAAGYFKGETYKIKFTKTGFYEQTYTLYGTFNGWYIANVFLPGNLIWLFVVDPLTGAMYNLPESVNVSLNKIADAEQPRELKIVTYDSLTDEQKAKLQRLN